ncbi:hypothetical protein EQG63_01910 [Flavobacterium amnicola]|uniref:Uncharacterized protein n=1 Tax=Flavobacterium amnicola TaxID=2506422 RepID=A0A4Q1K552_9FLAO|nr:hypothetical protein [Flavobacterium amnicola]RXR20712.1 hypothetical protein EQG63_01910 [Flavobacterium amnicola]
MKTKKLNLDRFKDLQLTTEESKNIICGIDDKPKPKVVIIPGGGPTDPPITCYYDFDDVLIYCKRADGTIISGTY